MKKIVIVGLHALVLWALCGATMVAGRAAWGIKTALVVHVLAAPVFAALVSWHYFKKYGYTGPFATAVIFLAAVAVLDAGLVAPVFEKSYVMFRSVLGVWVPFGLIFLATWLTGLIWGVKNAHRRS